MIKEWQKRILRIHTRGIIRVYTYVRYIPNGIGYEGSRVFEFVRCHSKLLDEYITTVQTVFPNSIKTP